MVPEEQYNITPTELVYIKLCQRKFWLYRNGVRPEFENEAVQIGKTVSQTTYPKLKHEIILPDFGVLDAAVLKNKEIYEIKKSSKRKDLDDIQTYAYLEWLSLHNIDITKAVIKYPLEKKTRELFLNSEALEELKNLRFLAEKTSKKEEPPKAIKIKACEKCAYQEHCFDQL